MKHFYTANQIKYIILTYITIIVIMTLFRVVIVAENIEQIAQIINEYSIFLLIKSFFMGWRFDTIVACFLLLPTITFLFFTFIFRIRKIVIYKIIHTLNIAFISISMLISCIDIPYFSYFFQRFNIQGLMWIDNMDFIIKMLMGQWTYLIFLFVFIAVMFGFILIMNKIFKYSFKQDNNPQFLSNIIIYILIIVSCIIGMRGRLEIKATMKVGTAYFSPVPLINQMSLNPTFTLFKSLEEQIKSKNIPLSLIDNKFAEEFAKNEMQKMKNDGNKREITLPNNTNIIVVIMESMGCCNVGFYNNLQTYTPYLDNLIKKSVNYLNVYTAGIHTYNGVYSTLFGEPALLNKHSMQVTNIPYLKNGLPNILKQNGYKTIYFTTHDKEFDNTAGFLTANKIDKIISQNDYQNKDILSTLGVPDHIMFEKAVNEINQISKNKFFAALLTSSNHAPYILPENLNIHYKSNDIKTNIVQYSDWAIGYFIDLASKQQWFQNTLFVFVADHGSYKNDNNFETPLTLNHTPLIFYMPSYLQHRDVDNIGLQMDVPALVCGYLGIDNDGIGIDFEIHPRKYIFFSQDDKLAVMDNAYLYVWNTHNKQFLYKYRDNNDNIIKFNEQKSKEMQYYGFSFITFANKAK